MIALLYKIKNKVGHGEWPVFDQNSDHLKEKEITFRAATLLKNWLEWSHDKGVL